MKYNVIYNEDCLEGLKKLPDKSIDLIVTDPPYNIETSGCGIYKQKDKQYIKELNNIKDGFDPSILSEMVRVMKKINIYMVLSKTDNSFTGLFCKRKRM